MSRKVKVVYCHNEIFIRGLGQLGKTLPPASRTIPGLELTLEEGVALVITAPGVEFHVPITNVAGLELFPEDKGKK